MKITERLDSGYTPGRSRKITTIVVHWWNLPENAGTLTQTVDYLLKAEESVHYVVSDKSIVRMVAEKNTAWHARDANPFSIGIEIDPKLRGETYATVAKLVADICKRYKLSPTSAVQPHSKYVATRCPGIINWNKIRKDATSILKGDDMYKGNTAKHWYERTIYYKNQVKGLKTVAAELRKEVIKGDKELKPGVTPKQEKYFIGQINELNRQLKECKQPPVITPTPVKTVDKPPEVVLNKPSFIERVFQWLSK